MDDKQRDIFLKFIEEVKKNSTSVVWGYGFDSVIFIDKDVDGNKSLKTLVNEILSDKD